MILLFTLIKAAFYGGFIFHVTFLLHFLSPNNVLYSPLKGG